jgi:hypothetical protein
VRDADDIAYYPCYFCGEDMAEDDPERRDLWFAFPGQPIEMGSGYACHPRCAAAAAAEPWQYMDPKPEPG